MKKILITAFALSLAVPALAEQQDIAQISAVTASREALRTAVNTQLSAVQANFDEVYAAIAAGPVYVNASAPADTKVVWIDTDQNNAIKAYIGGAWTVVGTAGEAYTYPSAAGVANWDGSAWGTGYTVGTAANNLVQLNASAQLPAVSADLLTITDTGAYFTTDTVGAALQELGSDLSSVTEITLDPNTLAVTDGVLAVIGGTGTGGYLATPPTYSDEACTPGQYALSESYRWDCVATGNWNRTALTDWSNPTPVPPTLTSATVGTAGLYADLLFSETVEAGTGGNGGWSMSCATTGAISMTYSSGDTTNTLSYSLSDTPIQDETCTVAYTQPTDGIEAVDDGADLATIASAAVTNNSTVQQTAGIYETFDTDTSGNYVIMTGTGTLAVTGGYLYQTNNTYGRSFWAHKDDIGSTDQHVYGTIDNSTSDPVALLFKVDSTANTFYSVSFTTAGLVELRAWNNGSGGTTSLASSGAYTVGPRLVDITTSGTAVTVLVDGATAISGTLADSFSGTEVGVGVYRDAVGNKIYDFNAEAN